jgi:hypothetical protein
MTFRLDQKQILRIGCALWAVVCLGAPVAAQRGALTVPRNLGELVDQAETIVRGHVVGALVEPHPEMGGLQTVVVTLRVEETFKGAAGNTFTFRQFIWDARDRLDAAGYKKGQHWLLLLNRATPYGLTSPAGIEQGRFRIVRDAAGHEAAVNGAGNRGLLRNLAPMLKQRKAQLSPELSARVKEERGGPIALDDLRELIRQLKGSAK